MILNKKMTCRAPFMRFLLLSGFILTFINGSKAAENSEASRILVHTLNYISRDYPNGIANGKIINQDEYTEMLGFCVSAEKYYVQFAPDWPADSQKIGTLIRRTDSLVHAKAPLADVSSMANTAKAEVIRASGLIIAPTKYPSIMNGKAVFMAQCAKCHGNSGLGDGKEGEKLDPRPRNFHDEEKMSLMSPFTIYNTVRCGVQGTGMKAHPDLSDEEVWDAAFYVLTLRYEQPGDKGEADKIIKGKFASLTLAQIATMSDKEVKETYKANRSELAVLRYSQPTDTKGQFIGAALKYIDESLAACRDGNYEEAEKLSSMAYLEGIEPIEKQLRSSDPALMERLEDQMGNTRKIISAHKSLSEVSDSLKASKVLIAQAGDAINTGGMSFLLAVMMSISILLREGLEAFLVIMVILGIIKASGDKSSKIYIHAGWIVAVICGVVLWIIGGQVIQSYMAQVELMEGIIAFVAVALLLYIGFWLHGKSEVGKWKAYVSDQVKNVTGKNSMLGLFALSFFVVFREVFESVLFLSAINIESSGKQEHAIILGVVVAFIMVIALAWVVLKFSAKLPIPKLFKISSIVMGALAVILAGKGVHSFQETGYITIHGYGFLPRVELLGIFPTIEALGAQVVVLLIVIYVMKFVNRTKMK
jgi:high-affinity iron transporter